MSFVLLNPNEVNANGGWDLTEAKILKYNAPVTIADTEISHANMDLAEAFMFD